jgi:hypothetical protein
VTTLSIMVAGVRDVRGAARLALVVAGVAAGVVLLLAALSLVPARDRQHERSDRRSVPPVTGALAPGTPYLLWAPAHHSPMVRGRALTVFTAAASGTGAPPPLGATRVPAPGTVLVSPALRDLLASAGGRAYSAALAGRVVGTLGEEGVVEPGELVAVRGDTFAHLRATGAAWKVVSWSGPLTAGSGPSPPMPLSVRVAVLLGALGLLIPIAVFIAAGTRVAAASREQRYAAMRLVGATAAQVRAVAIVEASVAASIGAVAGLVLALALRPLAADVSLVGFTAWPADLAPPRWQLAAVVLAAPLLGAASAVVALRRVSISPLGVRRQTRPARATWRRLIPVAITLVELTIVALAGQRIDPSTRLVAIAAGFAGMMAALMYAGPWIVAVLARLLSARAARAGALIAARRLEMNPGPAYRAVSGVALAVFAATTLLVYQGSTSAADRTLGAPTARVKVHEHAEAYLAAPISGTLTRTVRRLSGVRAVVTLRTDGMRGEGAVGQCETVARLAGVAARRCRAGVLVVRRPGDRIGGLTKLRMAGPDGAQRTARGRIAGFLPPDGVLQWTAPERVVPWRAPPTSAIVDTDGSLWASQRVHGAALAHNPKTVVFAPAEEGAAAPDQAARDARKVRLAVMLMLCVAGCSLIVMLVDGLVERRRGLATLVAAGTPARQLRLATAWEVLVPLVGAAAAAGVGGLAVATLLLLERGTPLSVPWADLGVVLALCAATGAAVVTLTLPALGRSLRPEHLRAP